MAQVSPQHINPLTSGFVGIVVLAILMLGTLNYLADKR